MTNADKLRDMTDEELSVNLSDWICDKVTGCPFTHGMSCEQCRLEWLKQEVSEDAAD